MQNSNYRTQIDTQSQQIKHLNDQVEQLNWRVGQLVRIAELNHQPSAIRYYLECRGKPMVIVGQETVDWLRSGQVTKVEFNLHNLADERTLAHSYSQIKASMKYDEHYEYLSGIFIEEFLNPSEHRSKGYGSILIRELLRYAKRTVCQNLVISGKLSTVDEQNENNRIRRDKLYENFGFKREGNKITLKIKDVNEKALV